VKIGILIQDLLVEGGTQRQTVCLARALVRQGHDVTVYTSAYDRQHCFPEICRDLTIRDVGRGALRWLHKPLYVRGYLDMRHLVACVKEPAQVWNPHDWPAQWAALKLKRKFGGVIVWTCNDVPNFAAKARAPRSLTGLLRVPMYWLYYVYDRAQNRGIELTAFLSEWAERGFREIYPGNTTRVVRSGADPEHFQPGGDRSGVRARVGFRENDFVVLWLGIFMPHRRLEDAIAAIARLKARGVAVKLLLAGSDRSYPWYFRRLQDLARELDVEDCVTFFGFVEEDAVRDFYCAADAFLFPNENQTWGLAVFEAMACNRPVLVSRGAAVHEVLTDGENALLFPARDPEGLAAKIELLLRQPELRARLAQNGMQLVRSTYNWDAFGRRMSQLFTEVAGIRVAEQS
jgi:glycosyltransferase involved in cell wall biosynthesis